jgi:hypothetical protein
MARDLGLRPQIIHLYQLLLIIIPMLHLKSCGIVDLTRIARPLLIAFPNAA